MSQYKPGEIPNDYTSAKKVRNQLEADVDRKSKILKALSGGGAMNLTPDLVRKTSQWQKANYETAAAFRALQNFNIVFVKRFKKEIQQERESKHEKASNPRGG